MCTEIGIHLCHSLYHCLLLRTAGLIPRPVNCSLFFFFAFVKVCFWPMIGIVVGFFFFHCLFFLNKRSGLRQAISSFSEKNGSDSSLTAVSGFRNSIWHRDALGVRLAAYISRGKKKTNQMSRRR